MIRNNQMSRKASALAVTVNQAAVVLKRVKADEERGSMNKRMTMTTSEA